MKSPHAILEMLRAQRDILAQEPDSAGQFSLAVYEVLEELTRRAQVIADQYPEDEDMTIRLVLEMPAVIAALTAITNTTAALHNLIDEGTDAVSARRDRDAQIPRPYPFRRLRGRPRPRCHRP